MLAIDISSEFLHLLELKTHRKGWEISAYATEPLPKGVINLQRLVDAAQFSQALQRALKQLSLRPLWGRRKVIMALPVNQTIMKTVAIVPDLPQHALMEHLQQTVDSQTAAHTTEVLWDYANLTHPDQNLVTEVILTIAQQATVQAYQQVFAENHLALQVVDIENYALTRAAMACSLANAQDKTYGILLLRKELITLVVVTAKQHMYARTAPLEPAENYAASMVQTIGQLVKSVNFSHDFVEVTELLLAGEYAEDSLADLISQKLHLPVSLVTPPPRVQGCMAAEVFPHYFLSLGLALWSK